MIFCFLDTVCSIYIQKKKIMKVYTKDIINKMMQDYENGIKGFYQRSRQIWHQNIIGIRKSGVNYLFSDEELKEFAKCYNSIVYFAENYAKIKLIDNGVGQISLRDYQKEALKNLEEQRFNLFFRSRQVGLSISLSIYFLYEAIFHNKSIVILPFKVMNGKEFIERTKNIYKRLPFFLQVGAISWSEKKLEFENGGKISFVSTWKPDFVIAPETDIVLLNEFSRFPFQHQEGIFTNAFKTVSTKKDGRLIIDSGINGADYFSELIQNAERPVGDPKKNVLNVQRIYWWQVPGRDEKWKQDVIKMIGEEWWDKEYDLCFVCKKS
jgi:hypothetical protein